MSRKLTDVTIAHREFSLKIDLDTGKFEIPIGKETVTANTWEGVVCAAERMLARADTHEYELAFVWPERFAKAFHPAIVGIPVGAPPGAVGVPVKGTKVVEVNGELSVTMAEIPEVGRVPSEGRRMFYTPARHRKLGQIRRVLAQLQHVQRRARERLGDAVGLADEGYGHSAAEPERFAPSAEKLDALDVIAVVREVVAELLAELDQQA